MAAPCQKQNSAEYGKRHDDDHFIGDGKHRGNGHGTEGDMRKPIADKRVALEYEGHAQHRGAKRGKHTGNEGIADEGIAEIYGNHLEYVHYL